MIKPQAGDMLMIRSDGCLLMIHPQQHLTEWAGPNPYAHLARRPITEEEAVTYARKFADTSTEV